MKDMDSDATELDVTAKRIQELEEKKRRLLQEVSEIDLELQNARAHHRQLLNRNAPISVLPYEIFSTIFLMCRRMHTSKLPLEVAVSHVSNEWRDMALGTPLLWNHIHLNLPLSARSTTLERRLGLLHLYLRRSVDISLEICIQVSGNIDWTPLLDTCLDHLSRCRELSISITSSFSAVTVGPAMQKLSLIQMPRIEFLSLNFGHSSLFQHESEQFHSLVPTIMRGGAPLLSFVRLSGVAGPFQPPLGNVTSLHIEGHHMSALSLRQFRAFMGLTPGLVNLTLGRITVAPEILFPSERDPVSLPSLRHLRISGIDDTDEDTSPLILAQLPLERIETLALQEIPYLGDHVFPAVHTLTLTQCNFPTMQVEHTVTAFPALVDLNCDLAVVTPLLILSYQDASQTRIGTLPPMWRKLEILTLRQIRTMHCGLVASSVLNRNLLKVPLKVLSLDKDSNKVLRVGGQLESLRSIVQVEAFDYFEPWPPGLSFECVDDDTFPMIE